MNKHHTLIFIKYGKLINEINNEITDQNIRDDILKFLKNFPGTLKYPIGIWKFNICWDSYKQNTQYGSLIFRLPKLSYIRINFDGNNNFKIWRKQNLACFNSWVSIDNIEYYVHKHPSLFNDILCHKRNNS